jgi:hypothetical protein
MKLKIACIKCFQLDGIKEPVFSAIEFGESNIHEATCERGHITTIALTQHKHEILFEIGAMALLDGYPREAIVTIASALERFYEVYIRVICEGAKIPSDHVKAAWKHIENASERQYGAYLFTSLISSQECPLVIDNAKPSQADASKANTKTWKEFRNAVVHKGFIPTASLAIEYGELVYAHINELTKKLTLTYGDEWLKEAQKQATQELDTNPEKEIMLFGLPTTLFLARGTGAPENFRHALEQLKGYREIYAK